MYNIIKTKDILIPKKDFDYNKWSVVACDQFTSQKDYWNKLYSDCGEYSTLNVIYPEAFLNENQEERLTKIKDNMVRYINEDIFDCYNNLILVERTTNTGLIRIGLVLSIDLECYDYTPKSNNFIKATELTVVERLPVRVKIRENALIELPHVMLLMDDRKKDIIEPLYKKREKLQKIYDFDLNMNGGHLRGYLVNKSDKLVKKLYKLINDKELIKKYGSSDNKFLFAVGDGNHSLASAKLYWNQLKQTLNDEEKKNHPARFALCELVNLHCEGLLFEPIHRVILNADESFIKEMSAKLNGTKKIRVLYNKNEYIINVSENSADAIYDIGEFIDGYIKIHNDVKVDYIHGSEHLIQVSENHNGIAIFMPSIEKDMLFKYVLTKGSLPRKAFSMGEAEDKRYYMESRKIKTE